MFILFEVDNFSWNVLNLDITLLLDTFFTLDHIQIKLAKKNILIDKEGEEEYYQTVILNPNIGEEKIISFYTWVSNQKFKAPILYKFNTNLLLKHLISLSSLSVR